jgi:hypothetical protein
MGLSKLHTLVLIANVQGEVDSVIERDQRDDQQHGYQSQDRNLFLLCDAGVVINIMRMSPH